MNSGELKTYKYVKISKSNFFMITILSLHSICSESKKLFQHVLNLKTKLKSFTCCSCTFFFPQIIFCRILEVWKRCWILWDCNFYTLSHLNLGTQPKAKREGQSSAFVVVGRIAPDEERLVLSKQFFFYLWCVKRYFYIFVCTLFHQFLY